jgi:hypothetical protein
LSRNALAGAETVKAATAAAVANTKLKKPSACFTKNLLQMGAVYLGDQGRGSNDNPSECWPFVSQTAARLGDSCGLVKNSHLGQGEIAWTFEGG